MALEWKQKTKLFSQALNLSDQFSFTLIYVLTMHWHFSSFSALKLFFCPLQWRFLVILTPSSRPANEPLTHAMSFTLRGLQSGSVYEAIVQAKNRYGWNEVSALLILLLSSKGNNMKVLKFKFIFLTHFLFALFFLFLCPYPSNAI